MAGDRGDGRPGTGLTVTPLWTYAAYPVRQSTTYDYVTDVVAFADRFECAATEASAEANGYAGLAAPVPQLTPPSG